MVLRLILLIILLPITLLGETWERTTSKRSGEVVTITWEYPDGTPVTGFSVYRQTGVAGTPIKIASLTPDSRSFDYTMPTGTTQQYRFLVRPVLGSDIGPAGNEVIVRRIR